MKFGNWMTERMSEVNAFQMAQQGRVQGFEQEAHFKEWNDRSCRLANALRSMA